MKTSLKILLTFCLFVSCNYAIAQDFFQAIEAGEIEKVEQFIHDDPHLLDSIVQWGCTPLMFAAYLGKDSIVEFLLKNGADIYKKGPSDGMNPLHLASMRNYMTVVNILIKASMDVNIKDGANKTALIYAIENNNVEIIDLLLKANAKLPEEQELMNLCLHSAVLNNLQDIADQLLNNKASLTSVDKNGRSLLQNAVIGKNLKWIDLLIVKNANINAVDSFNRTPLHYSVEQNQLDISKLLVQNGANINSIDGTNRTPLYIAKGLVYTQIAEFLESKGGILSEPKIFEIGNDGNQKSDIKVTYIANMGVLISSASKTILIDGLFNESYYYMLTPHENVITKINNFEPPFNSIDLILVTHGDGDHFSAPMIADYLGINPSVKVICNKKTAFAIKESINPSVDSTRIIGITPDLCTSTDTLVNNLIVKVLRLRHSGQGDESDNLGFLFDLDGVKVFHSGDSDGYVAQGIAVSGIQEYDSIGIEEMNIDLAILNRGSLWDSNSPGIQIIEKYIKPKHIILTHYTENNKQGEWETVDQTIKRHKDELPDITVFKWQMQDIIIQKGN